MLEGRTGIVPSNMAAHHTGSRLEQYLAQDPLVILVPCLVLPTNRDHLVTSNVYKAPVLILYGEGGGREEGRGLESV